MCSITVSSLFALDSIVCMVIDMASHLMWNYSTLMDVMNLKFLNHHSVQAWKKWCVLYQNFPNRIFSSDCRENAKAFKLLWLKLVTLGGRVIVMFDWYTIRYKTYNLKLHYKVGTDNDLTLIYYSKKLSYLSLPAHKSYHTLSTLYCF